MNFLVCDGDWLQEAGGLPTCSGRLVTFTEEELRGFSGSVLTWEQVSELQGEVLVLFAAVFGFLVLKKLL